MSGAPDRGSLVVRTNGKEEGGGGGAKGETGEMHPYHSLGIGDCGIRWGKKPFFFKKEMQSKRTWAAWLASELRGTSVVKELGCFYLPNYTTFFDPVQYSLSFPSRSGTAREY